MEFVIFKDKFENTDSITVEFFIDDTIGRDVTIQIDYVVETAPGPFNCCMIDGPGGFHDEKPFEYDRSKVFIITYPTLEVKYKY